MDGLPTKIGVLDSGVGGLSVLREIHRLLPDYPTIYVADQQHLPYGARPAHEVRAFVFDIVRFLIDQGAAVIVLACNAASAASLLPLREAFPHIPFVGMEPAVKPAAESTRTGVIGVLTTRTTANGQLYARVLDFFTHDVRVITQVAPELVTIVEGDSQHTPESRGVIQGYIAPLVEAGADRIVLGCTHFPFLAPTIQQMVGSGITLVDPGPAVARQVARVWPRHVPAHSDTNQYFTSGDPAQFQNMLRTLIGVESSVHPFH
jgi:glutamate racemase